jgi:glucokinase
MLQHAIIGLDVGGTKTLAVLFDDKFKVIAESRFHTEPALGARTFEKRLSKAFTELLAAARDQRKLVVGTGVGCSGNIHPETMELQLSPHIPFLTEFPLRQKISQWTRTEVCLGNDVQLGLYGEHQLGAAQGSSHAIGIFIGTGIGGAMIINGRLHTGANGVAGDIGHYLVQPLGPLGGSLRQGCLDNVASRTAISAEAAVYASRQWAPNLMAMAGTDLAKIRSKTLARAIKAGDKQLEELVRSRAGIIGIVLSNLVDFINPDTIVLGGGLVEEMPNLVLNAVTTGIQEHSTPAAFKKLRVVVTKLKAHAVASGAAKMAWDRFIAQESSRR